VRVDTYRPLLKLASTWHNRELILSTQYLVTARHVVEDDEHPEVRLRGNIVDVELERLHVPCSTADVAVFRLARPIVAGPPLPADADDFTFGQEAYFLGYPLGLTFEIGPEYFPLVKRAILWGIGRPEGNHSVLLLDGWNNPGFSGGPVVFRPGISAWYAGADAGLRHHNVVLAGIF